MTLRTKRCYDPPSAEDGQRVLIDRLWPHGLRKADARIDLWLREIAPSAELRRWFGHDPARWEAFRARYFEELDAQGAAVAELRRRAKSGPLTLLYAAKDTAHNNAVALKEYLARCR